MDRKPSDHLYKPNPIDPSVIESLRQALLASPFLPQVLHKLSSRVYTRQLNHVLKTYGLSQLEYEAIIQSGQGSCALCERQCDLIVDHDHATGKVRGLLCTPCNLCLNEAVNLAWAKRLVLYLGKPDGA